MERFNGFIGTNLLPRLQRKGIDLDQINEKVMKWVATVADTRVLRAFGETRLQRFEKEIPLLGCVPLSVDCSEAILLQVRNDSTIQHANVRYTVPPELVATQIELRVDPLGNPAKLYSGSRFIREFSLVAEGSSCRKVEFPEDKRALKELWNKQEDLRLKRQARKDAERRLLETGDPDVRSPSVYDQILEEAA